MRFWDSSAVVPVVVAEAQSGECARLLRDDPGLVVWALTPVEVLSAIYRKLREGQFTQTALEAASERLESLRGAWDEVIDLDLVRTRAERLVAVHPIRAADSLQLGAALIACGENPKSVAFVCFDARLGDAARSEGFRVLP